MYVIQYNLFCIDIYNQRNGKLKPNILLSLAFNDNWHVETCLPLDIYSVIKSPLVISLNPYLLDTYSFWFRNIPFRIDKNISIACKYL